jgi:maleate isomerase
MQVDLTTGEGLAPGVRSIRRDSPLDQRRLNTVQWLERHRRPFGQLTARDASLPRRT